MPTRRDFLQSALLLPAALTTGKVFAEDTSKPNAAPTTDVFADFESGNYEGWTIEGDAFGTAPATDALFPGKIRGFTGRGFLCSLHPRKGNAATGKAISKEFTIEKSFITFKIGGGNHPNQACLNLIVDNQIVYTATGDGTANLSESSFDVSNLVGRKAHIEIVDATASADRGYIMVDDIVFFAPPPIRPPVQTSPLLVLLCCYADSPKVPAERSAYEQAFGTQFPAFGHYILYRTSGRHSIAGTKVVGWLRLPYPKSHYMQFPDDSSRRIAIIRDGAEIVKTQIDFAPFKHIVVFSSENFFQSSGEAGPIEIESNGRKRRFTWAFINDSNLSFQHRTIIHEVGHALGLFHTWGQEGPSNPSWWSGMCGQSEYYAKGPNPHPYFGYLPLTYNGYDRLLLNGIAPEQVLEIKIVEQKTLDLINLNSPEFGSVLLVRIPKRDGKTFYTVEARMFDKFYDCRGVLRSEGIVIHEVEPGRNRRPTKPGSNAFDGADALVVCPPNIPAGNGAKTAWKPGQIFTDTENGVQIQTLNPIPHGFRVAVSITK
jgi:hypothetical protein